MLRLEGAVAQPSAAKEAGASASELSQKRGGNMSVPVRRTRCLFANFVGGGFPYNRLQKKVGTPISSLSNLEDLEVCRRTLMAIHVD